MLEKAKNLRLRGNMVLGDDEKFVEQMTSLEDLVHERKRKLQYVVEAR